MTDQIAANDRRARALVLTVAVPIGLVLAIVVGIVVPIAGLVVGVVATVGVARWIRRAGPGLIRTAIDARPANLVTEARLHNIVDGLCGGAGVPKPALLVITDKAPNALSFGLDPRHASVAVTTGLLDRLGRVELEGVLARELARIKHHDTTPATVAVALLTVLGPIPPLAARVRHAASRTLAVTADANGVALTRYPPGLAAALEKLRAGGGNVAGVTPATAHLWVEPPSSSATPDVHPPLEERIEALREL